MLWLQGANGSSVENIGSKVVQFPTAGAFPTQCGGTFNIGDIGLQIADMRFHPSTVTVAKVMKPIKDTHGKQMRRFHSRCRVSFPASFT